MNFPTDNTGQQNLAILKSFIAPVLLVQNFSRKAIDERRKERLRGKGEENAAYRLRFNERVSRVSLFFFGKQTFEALKRDFQGHFISIPQGK